MDPTRPGCRACRGVSSFLSTSLAQLQGDFTRCGDAYPPAARATGALSLLRGALRRPLLVKYACPEMAAALATGIGSTQLASSVAMSTPNPSQDLQVCQGLTGPAADYLIGNDTTLAPCLAFMADYRAMVNTRRGEDAYNTWAGLVDFCVHKTLGDRDFRFMQRVGGWYGACPVCGSVTCWRCTSSGCCGLCRAVYPPGWH